MGSEFRAYCAPVRQPPFEHNGLSFLANGVKRCPSNELWGLLTWKDVGTVLDKEGEPLVDQPLKYEQPDAEFFSAQCAHYGLKRSKAKGASRKELIRAFGNTSGTLTVPKEILQIEKKLAKEFKTANQKARSEHEEGLKQRRREESKSKQKRGRVDDGLSDEVATGSDQRKKMNKSAKSTKPPFDLRWYCRRYRLSCPYVSEQWGRLHDESDFCLWIGVLGSDSVYGHFDLGVIEGYMRATEIDDSNHTITFNWRGRETGEGECTYGDDNVIRITLTDDLDFAGFIVSDLFGKREITGTDESREVFGPMGIRTSWWKAEYDELNEENCEMERMRRWG